MEKTKQNQYNPNQAKQIQSKPNEQIQTRPIQTKPCQIKPIQTNLIQYHVQHQIRIFCMHQLKSTVYKNVQTPNQHGKMHVQYALEPF
jgi:hypothetical protein